MDESLSSNLVYQLCQHCLTFHCPFPNLYPVGRYNFFFKMFKKYMTQTSEIKINSFNKEPWYSNGC